MIEIIIIIIVITIIIFYDKDNNNGDSIYGDKIYSVRYCYYKTVDKIMILLIKRY